MVVIADTAGKPQAVVIKPTAAAFTQLAMFGSLGNHNLKRREGT